MDEERVRTSTCRQKNLPISPGRSLLLRCRGEAVTDWRTAAQCESYNHIASNDIIQWARTIRNARYRYTFYAAPTASNGSICVAIQTNRKTWRAILPPRVSDTSFWSLSFSKTIPRRAETYPPLACTDSDL